MDFEPTQQSLDLVRQIASNVVTFHHHYHILYDIANSFGDKLINYVEIGAYAGGSSCLMLQRANTTIISIDLGEPIPKEVVLENVIKYKTSDTNYRYIQGNSQVADTKDALMNALNEPGVRAMGYGAGIDILFIDGDHSFAGVVADFALYGDLVNIGGYIVFDDYHDCVYSPEVKQAVDSLLPGLVDYEVLGTLENALGAYPSDLEVGNCFVIKKVN